MKSAVSIIAIVLALLINESAQAATVSAYSSLEEQSCVIYDAASLHKDFEIDFLVSECPGFGGYQLMVSGGDLRYPLSLVYQGKEIELTRMHHFHSVSAPKVEWVFERRSEDMAPRAVNGRDVNVRRMEEPLVRYKALIHRIRFQKEDGKDTDVLIVTKLAKEKSCTVAVIKASKTMNEDARAAADSAEARPCLDLDQVSYE